MLVKHTVIWAFVFLAPSAWAGGFFPEYAFSERPDHHQFTAEWYGEHLKAMNEPSLFESSSNKGAHLYRFLWLRTFHDPIAVRLIVNDDGSGRLIAKVTSGAGGYEPGEITQQIDKPISPEDVHTFERALDCIFFWELPTNDDNWGLDGAQWIIEGVKDGKYHIVDRFSPSQVYGELALFLVNLADIKVDRIY